MAIRLTRPTTSPSENGEGASAPSTDLALVNPVGALPTELTLPDDLSYDEWLEVGDKLAHIEHAVRWWWGDWLNYGEHRYERGQYDRAVERSGLSKESVRACKWVAGSIESVRRRTDLPWSLHEEVAALEPDVQDEWLDKAEDEHLNRKRLRAMLKGPKPVPPAVVLEVDAAPVGPLLRFMYEVPSATIVTLILRICFPDAQTALDPCYGLGNFWDGTAHVTVTAHDEKAERAPDGVMDVTDLGYEDASFDVVIFDPPHLADGGDESEMAERFGTVKDQAKLEEMIENGVRECWRVCIKGIVVKVADHNHGEVFNDMSLLVCDAVGHWPYDKVYQVREHAFIDPSWGPQMTAYNNGAVYLIFRKGDQKHVQRG